MTVEVAGLVVEGLSPELAPVRHVVADAARQLLLRRVILFGSRARGDARSDSDVDLAFVHDSDDAAWAEFVAKTQDTAPTLLSLDLVNLRHAASSLRQRIDAEGIVIYERS